jgi:hypothetical protein
MDATTNQKTLSGVLVALLVGSVLLPGALAVHAGVPNPTSGVSTAWVDAGASTQSTVAFNTPYDLTITNASGTVGGGFRLFRAGSTVAFGNPAAAAADQEHLGMVNITFTNVALESVGSWEVRNSTNNATAATFDVTAQPNLQVALSQGSFPYSPSAVSYTVTVTNLSTGSVGSPVSGASLSGAGIPNGVTTNAAGTYTFFGPLPEAGTHLITATRDWNGDSLAELSGNVTLTVTPATLGVTGTNTVFAGFADVATWDVKFPNGVNAFGNNGATLNGSLWTEANLTVSLPNGTSLFVNMTTGSAGACQTTFGLNRGSDVRLNNGTNGCVTPTDTPLLTFATGTAANGGRISFRPGAQWTAGTYSFNVVLNTVGAGGSAAEYTVSWSQATTAPAAVNLKVYNPSGSNTQVSNTDNALEVLPATIGTSLGTYTLDLSIIGATATEFPTTLGWDAFTASNVTVTGDVLTGTGFNAVSLGSVGTNGRVTISNVVPTKVNGVVNLNVNWKNATTVLSLTIKEGADASADKTEIVVDQTSTVNILVKDVFGNTVPTATVKVLTSTGGDTYPGAFGVTINGTGAPGLGQGGSYLLNVRPTATGDMIVYTTIGSGLNQNYSYLKVRVAAAHDLAVTLGTNQSMAGNTTYVYLNATTAEGFAVTTASNYRTYFLNQTTLAELRLNGTSALAGIPYGPSGTGQSLAGAMGVNVAFGATGLSGANLNVSLDPGTYGVYVCSNMTGADCTTAKHDNINNTPTFTVSPWHAVFTPPQVASNAQLQSNTPVVIKVTNGANFTAPQGTLVRVRTSGTTGAVTPAIGTLTLNSTGEATFTVTGQTIGDIVFETDIAGSLSHWTALDTPFKVVGPNVRVTPDRIPLGRPATLVINVATLNGTALPNLQVQVCGTPIGGTDAAPGCTGNVTTDANGLATVGVNPLFTGNLTLRVSGVNSNVNVTVFAGLDIILSRANPLEGETQEITVSVIGQSGGATGVTVNVTHNGTAVSGFPQTTGSNGRVVVPNLQAGNYTVTATRQGFDPAMTTFTVAPAAANGTGARFSLSNLRVPATATVGQAITVNADVTNNGSADGTATVLLIVNGAVRDSRPVPVTAGSRETVAFDFTPNTASVFNVTVRLSTGESLPARSVNVTTPTGTTPVTSTPVTSTPATSTPASTPVVSPTGATTATPTPSTPVTSSPVEPNVPGFEVVALLGALAVALLVLRRRS